MAKAPSRDSAGFYDTPYGSFRSVTTSLKYGCPKEELIGWAASMTAHSALDHVPSLARVRGDDQRKQMHEYLRTAPMRQRDKAAAFGSEFHRIAEALILESPLPQWEEAMEPFVESFHNFVNDWNPEWEATELTLCHPEHGWAGTADWFGYLPGFGGALILGDWKTGKGVYKEAALQLSAYQRATHGFLRDGTEVTPPKADRAVVVHVRPEKYKRGGYRVVPVVTSDEHYEQFRAAQRVAEYTLSKDNQYLQKAQWRPAA